VTAAALIAALQSRGVVLTGRGESIGFDAPAGVMTNERCAAVKELKPQPPVAVLTAAHRRKGIGARADELALGSDPSPGSRYRYGT
jgi:hypothetical protein